MSFYEVTFITRADQPRAELQKLTDRFIAIVTEGKGKLVKQEYWGVRQLAYAIQKSNKGHYTMLAIEAPAEALFELERNIRINEDVVRHLTVRVDEIETGPSAVLRARDGDSQEAAA